MIVEVFSFWLFRLIYRWVTIPVLGPVALLGMEESGKSTFLNWLQKGEFVKCDKTVIDGEPYDRFSFVYKNKEYTLKSGRDISGAKADVKKYYEDLIESSNSILFFFNANYYINDDSYRKEVHRRVYLATQKYKEYNTKGKKTIGLIATHLDECNNGGVWTSTRLFANIANSVQKSIVGIVNKENSQIADVFNNNMIVCDLRIKESFEYVFEKFFKHK